MSKLNIFLLCIVIAIITSGLTFATVTLLPKKETASPVDKGNVPAPRQTRSESTEPVIKKVSSSSSSSIVNSKSSSSQTSTQLSSSTKVNSSSQDQTTQNGQSYTNQYYPSFKISGNSDWTLASNDTDHVSNNKTTPKGKGEAIFTNKNGSKLIISLTPGFATGFAGPLPCQKDYAVLSPKLIRVQTPGNQEQKTEPNWSYSDDPTQYKLKGSPDFDSLFVPNSNSIPPIDKKENVKSCGLALIPFKSKTTLDAAFSEPERKNEAWIKLELVGNADEATLESADKIVKSMQL
jgi:hypothetical protein